MASLTGNLISNSYQGLLKTSGSTAISSTITPITDGLGNSTPLSMSTSSILINGSTFLTGSINIAGSGSVQNIITNETITIRTLSSNLNSLYLDVHGIELTSGSNYLDITVDAANFQAGGSGSLIAVSDNTANPVPVIAFQNYNNYTNGTVSIITPLQARSGSQVTGSLLISGSLQLSTSSSFTLPLTASATPTVGTTYFSGSYLYIYNGTKYVSASFS